jgi:soluble lytic murein transglycosylase-like protein
MTDPWQILAAAAVILCAAVAEKALAQDFVDVDPIQQARSTHSTSSHESSLEQCIERAAGFYKVESNLVRAILVVEGGTNGMKNRNTNGTHDYGLMQVNTWWLDRPGMQGITETNLRHDTCTNVFVGTWILATEIRDARGDIWRGVGNYHSRTPKFHNRYRRKAKAAYERIVKAQLRRASKEQEQGINQVLGARVVSGDTNG